MAIPSIRSSSVALTPLDRAGPQTALERPNNRQPMLIAQEFDARSTAGVDQALWTILGARVSRLRIDRQALKHSMNSSENAPLSGEDAVRCALLEQIAGMADNFWGQGQMAQTRLRANQLCWDLRSYKEDFGSTSRDNMISEVDKFIIMFADDHGKISR